MQLGATHTATRGHQNVAHPAWVEAPTRVPWRRTPARPDSLNLTHRFGAVAKRAAGFSEYKVVDGNPPGRTEKLLYHKIRFVNSRVLRKSLEFHSRSARARALVLLARCAHLTDLILGLHCTRIKRVSVGITPQFPAIEAERRMGLRVEVGDRGMPVWLTAVAALVSGAGCA